MIVAVWLTGMLRKAQIAYAARALNFIIGVVVSGYLLIAATRVLVSLWPGRHQHLDGVGLLIELVAVLAMVLGACYAYALCFHVVLNLRLAGRFRNDSELHENTDDVRRALWGFRWFHRALLRARGIKADDVTKRILI